jgi:hypothetical protein
LAGKEKPCPRNIVRQANKSKRLSYQETLERAIHQVQPDIPGGLGKIPPTTIEMDIVIDETGRVVCATSRAEAWILVRFCRDAAMQWTFRPVLVNGRPVEVWGRIEFFIER